MLVHNYDCSTSKNPRTQVRMRYLDGHERFPWAVSRADVPVEDSNLPQMTTTTASFELILTTSVPASCRTIINAKK